MLARDIMARPVKRLTMNTTVREAAGFLLRMGISGAPVVDRRGRPHGVFTLNDLARHERKHVPHLPEVDSRKERAAQTGEFIPTGRGYHFETAEDAGVSGYMTPGVISVWDTAPVSEVVHLMNSLRVHRVFVLDEEGRLLGIITTMDIVKCVDRLVPKPAGASAGP